MCCTQIAQTEHMPCRCNLAGVMLQLMALGIPDVMNFDFMSKPSPGRFLKLRSHCGCTGGDVVAVSCLSVRPRGCAFCCGPLGAAGSCGEEGGAGSPHTFGEEDGQLSSGAQIC